MELSACSIAAIGTPSVIPVTWNPLDKHANITLSGGNMIAMKDTEDAPRTVRATHSRPHTDKFYVEFFSGSINGDEYGFGADYRTYGLATSSLPLTTYVGADAASYALYEETGAKITNTVQTAYGSPVPHNGIVQMWFNSGSLWFGINDVVLNSGDPVAGTNPAFTGITGDLFPAVSLYLGTPIPKHTVGLRVAASQFTYSPRTGYLGFQR